ncbi:MAG: hypothetical protein MAG431_02121 [Chloroflexi bacterium]|nr:hypothetical protein [Chloroflexota bacterium]
MTKYKNKYRIKSTRLPDWDYTSPGWYFVTICTKGRQLFFGQVIDGEMHLSPIGKIVAEEWQKTEAIRENVTLDEWVIMPNHLHGIIMIHERDPRSVETSRRGVSTDRGSSTEQGDSPTTKAIQHWKPGSLGAIIGQIKSVCTKRIWAAGYDEFGWQSRFYDHIIRDQASLDRIRAYIRNNPKEWEDDDYYLGNAKNISV